MIANTMHNSFGFTKNTSFVYIFSILLTLSCYWIRYLIQRPYFNQSLDMPDNFVIGFDLLIYVTPLYIASWIGFIFGIYVLTQNICKLSHFKLAYLLNMILQAMGIFLLINLRGWWLQVLVPNDWFYFHAT